mmetsp:Transcript_42285/g.101804  ORF Transcript_42285/g.101804 Transcript_42285/m.101804 type:complete len:825 (-) Transcript_42285:146-2620(-)
MSRPIEEEGDDEEAEEMFSDPNLVDNEDEYDDDDDDDGRHEEEEEDDGEGSYVDVDDEEEEDGEDYGDYYQDNGEGGEGEEYYEGSQSFSRSHSRSYSHSQNNNSSSRYEGEDENEDEDENGHDSGSYSQYDDDYGGEEGEGEEENYDDSRDYDEDEDDSHHHGDDDDIPHNETDGTDDFEDSKEYFDDQQDDDEDGGNDGDSSYYDDEDQDHYHDGDGSRAEEEGSYEDDDYDDDGDYVGDEGDESRSRSRRYEEDDDEDEGNIPSRSSYNNSPSRSSDRWSDGSDGRSPTSLRSPIENSPNVQPPVHSDDDHQSPEDMKREVQEILKAANERLSSPQKQKRGGGRSSSSVHNQEEGQETTAEPASSSNKVKPNGGSVSDAATANGTNGSRSAAKENQQNYRPNHDNGGRRSAESSVGETSLDNTGHMEALKEDRTNHSVDKKALATITSSETPAPASATKKDEGLPKGSTSSRSRRNGRMGGSSSHHRRRQQQGQGGVGGARISWKSDPEATFSDWTVRVYHDEGGGGMDKYFIHRNICGFGTRKSEYLLRAFQGQENEMTRPGIKSDMQNRTTLLDLPSSQARVFPMVLDFMYFTKEAKSTLTASRACDVFLLAGILEIPTLQKAISDFYLKNLNLKNMGEFLNAANQSKAEPLLVVCKSKIGKMITEKPTLAGLVPPKYLADILLISRQQLDNARAQDPERYPEQLVVSQSRYWSKAACICAVQNENILTKNLFELLTGEDALPYIDASVAQKLLALDKKFNGVEPDGYTSLQLRCIAGIADDFGSFQKGFQSEEAAVESLKEWPSHVLADILVKTMNKK